MTELQELEKITKDLTTKIIDCYKPESTRWNRNHTAHAEWYFIWKPNSIFMVTTPNQNSFFYDEWKVAKGLGELFLEYLIEHHPEYAEYFKKCRIKFEEDVPPLKE